MAASRDGTVVALGYPGIDRITTNAGRVAVFVRSGAGWAQRGSNISSGATYQDAFGYSVALSADGNVLAVGIRNSNTTGSNAGSVRVYTFSSGSWRQRGSSINGEASEDLSGYSVSLSANGNTVAIGAPNNDAGVAGQQWGSIRVYTWGSSGPWTKLGQDLDGPCCGTTRQAGQNVALSSDGARVAFTATGAGNSTLPRCGITQVYQYSAQTGQWARVGAEILGQRVNEFSGTSLAISSTGNIVAVGSQTMGLARVYQLSGTQWVQLGQDLGLVSWTAFFAGSISLSATGTTLAIGATGAGYVRVYTLAGSSWVQRGGDLTDTDTGIPKSAIIGAPITHAVFSPKLAALVAASAIVQSGLGHSGATTASNIFAGMTFALSLTLSTMVRPTKVLDFLGVTNTNRGWDPSLAFVMGGAVAVSLSMFQGLGLVGQGRTELQKFAARPISRSVIIGGILFGMGWAVAGLCPGPGITVASAGSLFSAAFTLSMWGGRIVGGMIKPLLEESCKQP